MSLDKMVAGKPNWSEPDGADKRVKLVAPLMIDHRVLRGLELIGRAAIELRNVDVSFTLVYHPTDNRRDAIQIARIDWRPKTPHANDHPRTPSHLMGEIVGTHHHSFALNWSDCAGGPLKWLPIAEEIVPDFQSFRNLVDGMGVFFRIPNAGFAIESPWPKDLFG
ncbi:MAG: hypothetical protein PHT60_09130 [Acidiphilium sp.]|nr:hypothetical protein [Acidiphilium sp.]MDD4935924.1 hypothetical protein [Acidiphilium sp.]